jgi:hypothetical protein
LAIIVASLAVPTRHSPGFPPDCRMCSVSSSMISFRPIRMAVACLLNLEF